MKNQTMGSTNTTKNTTRKKKHHEQTLQEYVEKTYGKNEQLYKKAKERFAQEEFVSPGMLQRFMKIPYFQARYILDRMIAESFCVERGGSWPCRVVK